MFFVRRQQQTERGIKCQGPSNRLRRQQSNERKEVTSQATRKNRATLGSVSYPLYVVFFLVVFSKSVKTAVPDDGNPPGALVLTKLVRILSLGTSRLLFLFLGCFFKKSLKTAVPEDGNPPGALVLTKLIEWYRFEVEHEKSCFWGVFFSKNRLKRPLRTTGTPLEH